MGPEIIRLGIRLEAISLNHSVRILHHLLLHTFRAPMRFVHALVPFVFPRQVGTMIPKSPSKFFPTALGISGRVTRRTTTFGMVSSQEACRSSGEIGLADIIGAPGYSSCAINALMCRWTRQVIWSECPQSSSFLVPNAPIGASGGLSAWPVMHEHQRLAG